MCLHCWVTVYGCRDPLGKPNLAERNITRMTGGILIIGRALVRGNRVLSPNGRFKARLRCP